MAALGRMAEQLGLNTKGVPYRPDEEVDRLAPGQRHDARGRGGWAAGPGHRRKDGRGDPRRCPGPPTAGWPCRDSTRWSSGSAAQLAHLAEGSEERRISFADTQAQPVPVIASPEWSGSEAGGRRYAPFTTTSSELKPWHTLTGRMHFFLDHDWMHEFGEALPIYRPPLDMHQLFGEPALGAGRFQTGRGALPHPALEVVDPLRVPGQPAHAVAVPRRARRSG